MAEQNRAAYGILLSDLLEHVLLNADNPVRCATALSEQLRRIIGVKTVLVFRCNTGDPAQMHKLLSVVPKRGKSLVAEPVVAGMVEAAHELPGITLFSKDTQTPPSPEFESIAAALDAIKAGTSIFVPLISGSQRMGILILLGIMDEHNSFNLISAMERLSEVLGLVLKNAYLYEHLELMVKERTTELESERRELIRTVKEKEILLKEVHHRVKNNLQIIDSLLYLQGTKSGEIKVQNALKDAHSRILSMAIVHAELYRSDDLSSVDLKPYIEHLVSAILNAAQVSLELDLTSVIIPLGTCISCGLIITEVITNAQKYAFFGRQDGILRVVTKNDEGGISLSISDNGPGIADMRRLSDSTTLGTAIINSLSAQIGGKVEWLSREGLTFKLTFRLREGDMT